MKGNLTFEVLDEKLMQGLLTSMACNEKPHLLDWHAASRRPTR